MRILGTMTTEALPNEPGSADEPESRMEPPRQRAGVRRYLLSLPERLTRATAALLGGAVYETGNVALPDAVRRTKLYQVTLDRLLRIMIEWVGDVRGVYDDEVLPVRELAARKFTGNVLELASIVAVGWSPLWLLAAASDVMGGSKAYLRALVAELQAAGRLPAEANIESYEALLNRLETGSGILADAIDVPPMRLQEARASLQSLRQQADGLPSAAELNALFRELQATAQREGRSLGEVSAAVGLAAARAGFGMGNAHIFDFYRVALGAIRAEGLVTFLRRTAAPYLSRAGRHFDPGAGTYTERALDRLQQRRHAMRRANR
jgi:hypothetical protein